MGIGSGFVPRTKVPGHRIMVAGEGISKGAAARAKFLIRHVYGHQVAVVPSFSDPRPDPSSPTSDVRISNSYIASLFYSKHYLRQLNLFDNAGNSISADEFSEYVLLAPNAGRRNNLCFLQGPVGSGKSALINYLLTVHGDDWWRNKKRWFVRFNLESQAHKENLGATQILRGLGRKLIKLVSSYPEYFPADSNIATAAKQLEHSLSSDTRDEVTGNLAALIRTITFTLDRQPVIFLDNIDFIIHSCDHGLFSAKGLERLNGLLGGACGSGCPAVAWNWLCSQRTWCECGHRCQARHP